MKTFSIQQIYRLHRWFAVIVGIQVILWILGGVVMSIIPIEQVRGQHLSVKTLKQHDSFAYKYSVDRLLLRTEAPQHIELADFLGMPVYRITAENKNYLFDAVSGAELSPLNESLVTQLAKSHYRGSGVIAGIDKLSKSPQGVPQINAMLWQVSFADSINTKLYFADDSGKLISTRSDIWYFYDFFWMLHIMDYEEREDFNNPLLISFAIFSLLFALSGLILTIYFLRKRVFRKR